MQKIIGVSKKLFLVDGLGALLSAALYGLVLANLESVFGMPSKVIYPLVFMALTYAAYSLSCYYLNLNNWRPFLKIIAIANLLHCCITLVLMYLYAQEITLLGVLYFIGEMIIVVPLAIIELKASNTTKKDA